MRELKFLGRLAICCAVALVPINSQAQDVFTAAQLDRVVKTDISSCDAISGAAATRRVEDAPIRKETVVPKANRQAFPVDRVRRTLNGVWRGEVIGDAGDVHVDYFWIIDMKTNEALIIAQRSGKNTLSARRMANATTPIKFSYLMCAHDGYSPGSNTPQVHEFTKISSSTTGAAAIVQRATGVKFARNETSLGAMWKKLVKSRYFDRLAHVAYAGGYFSPLSLQTVESPNGPQVALKWTSEYRGGGTTKLRYTTGVPMKGSEQSQFIGVKAGAGDFLLASPGNGALWKVEVVAGGNYDLSFDQVSIGPLEP